MPPSADRTPRAGRSVPAAAAALLACLAGCAAPGYDPPVGSAGIGMLGGAGAGALAGRAIAGSHNNLLAMGAGALIGGLAGNVLVDRPRDNAESAAAEAARDRAMQRQLDYQRLSQLQNAQVQQQITEGQQFAQWKAQRDAGILPPTTGGYAPSAYAPPGAGTSYAVPGPADLSTAQRLLTGLGYYRGPIDGTSGGQTRSAVMQFEMAQGLPATGVVTPALVGRMRAALAG